MITLVTLLLIFAGLALITWMDTLVYHDVFFHSLSHLFNVPSHRSALWFIALAVLAAGWADIKGTPFAIQVLNLRSGRKGKTH